MRFAYNKSFRLLTGVLGFLAGIFNFGIIPAIGARCLVYFLGLPPTLTVFSHVIPTYIPLMALFLSTALFIALSGGVITVLLVNCVEGIMSQLFYLIIIASLLVTFSWRQISTVLEAAPPGQSLLNPLDSSGVKDFNFSYVLMGLFINAYKSMAWQNSGRYTILPPFSAHESRMVGILGRWREMGKLDVVKLLGICALTYLHHPDFPAAGAAQVHASVNQISDPQVREQMEAPIALAYLLPMGVKGLFCAVLLMGVFGGDATHLHSWGSIFVQDVIVPRLKKPFGARQHLWVLRCSIAGVALFAFGFGVLFTQTDYILMWWAVTEAIFTGGAGAAIIGGLYWKKATAAGAWAAMLTGSGLSVGGILAHQAIGDRFPLNGLQISFFSMLIAIAVYVGVSLLTRKEDFNMDRMLHRGAYAPPGHASVAPRRQAWAGRLIGFDENFTLADKWTGGGLVGWGMLWFFVVIIGTVWNFMAPWSLSTWSAFWHVTGVGIPVLIAFVTAWVHLGGNPGHPRSLSPVAPANGQPARRWHRRQPPEFR